MSNPYSAPAVDSEPMSDHVEPEHPVAGPPPEPLKIRDGEALVTVHTATDAIEAEMLTQLLLAEGIPTPVFARTTGAQIGIGESLIWHPIRVPQSREVEARELIEALLEEQASNARVDDEEYEPPMQSDRRRMLTKGVAWLVLAPTILGVLLSLLMAASRFFER